MSRKRSGSDSDNSTDQTPAKKPADIPVVPFKEENNRVEREGTSDPYEIIALSFIRAMEPFIRQFARFLPAYIRVARRLNDSPQSQVAMEHEREIEKMREQGIHSQQLARADIDRALAKRIETAATVEVEEYFDASRKGYAGLNVDQSSAKIGVGGEGQRIVSRKIILKGSTTAAIPDEIVHLEGEPPKANGEEPPVGLS